MRSFMVGMLLACFLATSAEAGLRNALTTSLIGLQATNLLYPIQPIPALPEGALFIDPIASTRGNGVFREGPAFEYDPTTGGVTVFAPPMLGPADEFGSRQQYSPQSIRVVGGDSLAEAPSIPQVTKYRRNYLESSWYNWPPPQVDDDDPSFVVDEQADFFNLAISSNSIAVSNFGISGHFGIEVDFPSLLVADLESEAFDADTGSPLPNSIWPYLPNVTGALPDIHFVIDYQTNYSISQYLNAYQYSLLAVHQTGLVGFDQSAIPEPNCMILAFLALIAHGISRRGKKETSHFGGAAS
jgi:hypothetical protein